MNGIGHTGFTMGIISLGMIPHAIFFGFSIEAVLMILLASAYSYLPDLDIKMGIKHRDKTHNILSAVVVGAAFSIAFYLGTGSSFAIPAFFGGFLGVMGHCFGDILVGQRRDGSPYKIKALWPVSKKEFGYGFFKSGNKKFNEQMMTFGSLSLVVYLVFAFEIIIL